MDASDPTIHLLSSFVLPGMKVSQAKTTGYSVTMKQAINALIDGAALVTLIPIFISGIVTFWILPSGRSGSRGGHPSSHHISLAHPF